MMGQVVSEASESLSLSHALAPFDMANDLVNQLAAHHERMIKWHGELSVLVCDQELDVIEAYEEVGRRLGMTFQQ